MAEYSSHKPNTFCWVDLATNDIIGAKDFYSKLFGWTFVDVPTGDDMFYTMFHLNGKQIAGMMPMQPEQIEMGMPPFWSSYISTENADEILAKVQQEGGVVVMPAMDVMEEGRMAMIQDPEGAIIGIWQPKNHYGFAYKDVHGAPCWFEHGSHDSAKSIPFLEKVFGWTSNTTQMGANLYTTFLLGEAMVAGLYVMSSEMGDIPSHWLPYFVVNNIDEAMALTANLGGHVIMPKLYVDGVGNFGVISDPQGGVIGLLQA